MVFLGLLTTPMCPLHHRHKVPSRCTLLLEISVFVMDVEEDTLRSWAHLMICAYNTRNGAPSLYLEALAHSLGLGTYTYHCNVACIFSVWPSFVPYGVVVPENVSSKLDNRHKQLLSTQFGLFLP